MSTPAPNVESYSSTLADSIIGIVNVKRKDEPMDEIKLTKSWQELKDALDEARLIIQTAETFNKGPFRGWGITSPFQQRIDAFLDKYGRHETEEK
jgi:hypothetical protein